MAKSAYIHIPFCIKKCKYCDFLSFEDYKKIEDEYINYLLEEIRMYKVPKLETLYLGGGTPSLLSINNLSKITNSFKIDQNTEFTIEINPETVDFNKLRQLYEIGINRISLGIQSFNNLILTKLGRIHTSEKAKEIYYQARKIGFKNISIDLMFATPGQTVDQLKNDLREAGQLEPEHISIYSLTWEKGTDFYKKKSNGQLLPVSEEIELEMYEIVIEHLVKIGYNHYEISNFSRDCYRSKHNQVYWTNNRYYGLGLGASGYLENKRYSNTRDYSQYKNLIKNKKPPIIDLEIIDNKLNSVYKVITGLRLLNKGIIIENEKHIKIANRLVEQGMLLKDKNSFKLSRKGLFLADTVMMEFF